MAQKHWWIAFTKPAEGRDKEFNNWYTNRHFVDVLAVPGVVAGQRLRIAQQDHVLPSSYLALYQIESDEPMKVVDEIYARFGTPLMQASDALDMGGFCTGLFEPVTPWTEASKP